MTTLSHQCPCEGSLPASPNVHFLGHPLTVWGSSLPKTPTVVNSGSNGFFLTGINYRTGMLVRRERICGISSTAISWDEEYPPEPALKPEYVQRIKTIRESNEGKVYNSIDDFFRSLKE